MSMMKSINYDLLSVESVTNNIYIFYIYKTPLSPCVGIFSSKLGTSTRGLVT